MKELVHFTIFGSKACAMMQDTIEDFKSNNPDILYTKISVDVDDRAYKYYAARYPLKSFPSFLGIVDGKVQDGHVGVASRMILESLVR